MIDNLNELKQEAERIGLTNLTDGRLRQLARAKASAERLIGAMPRDLRMTDEPAHVFRAGQED